MPPKKQPEVKILVGITRPNVNGSFLSCGTPEDAVTRLDRMTKDDGQPRKLAWRIRGHDTIHLVDTVEELQDALICPPYISGYFDRA